MFDAPLAGDIFYQRAIIIEKKSPAKGRAMLILQISDEYGRIGKKIPDLNLVTIFENNFDEQFDLDPKLAHTFVRKVKITEIDSHEGFIHFHRFSRKGEVLSLDYKERTEKFLKTHFLSQEGDLTKKAGDEPILDLDEEVT